MPNRYQDVYPEEPLLHSADLTKPSAAALRSREYFEAEPGEMSHEVFDQHPILVNLREEPHRVENWRDGEHRDFTYLKNEIIVTPAGVRSGWRWHAKSKVVVITLDPGQLERFAQDELGVLLGREQLRDIPQFVDADLTQAAVMLMEALQSRLGSAVMFEGMARVFLVKLIQRYGVERERLEFSASFTARHYRRVLDYIQAHYGEEITLERLAVEAGLSKYHFSRLFKQTLGKPLHQFLMSYRVEQAKKQLSRPGKPMVDIALGCGFADQAHFSRVFKKLAGMTPRQYRQKGG